MEHTAKFNLEENVAEWKVKLSQNTAIWYDDLLELEGHLLDSIESLKSSGLDDEEAFFVARKRLGTIKNLTKEYNKVNSGTLFTNKVKPYLQGALLYLVLITGAKAIFGLSYMAGAEAGLNLMQLDWLSAFTLFLGTLVISGSIYFKYKKPDLKLTTFIKTPILITLIALFMSLDLFNRSFLTSQFGIETMGRSVLNFSIYHISFITLLFITSFIVFYRTRQMQKAKLA